MNDHEAVAEGQKAQRELDTLAKAFASVREACVNEIINSSPGASAKVERLIVTCQVLDAVQTALRRVRDSGLIAADALAKADLLRR